jgi:hypothetical protein
MTGSDHGVDPGSLVVDIVTCVGEAEGAPPAELPPLGETVDLDSLVSLFRRSSCPVSVTFEYLDWTVEVGSDGSVVLDPEG